MNYCFRFVTNSEVVPNVLNQHSLCSESSHGGVDLSLGLASGNSLLDQSVRDSGVRSESHQVRSEWDAKLLCHLFHFVHAGLGVVGGRLSSSELLRCGFRLSRGSFLGGDAVLSEHLSDNRVSRCGSSNVRDCRNRRSDFVNASLSKELLLGSTSLHFGLELGLNASLQLVHVDS